MFSEVCWNENGIATARFNRQPKTEPKPKPKPLNLNIEGLPDLKDVLSEVNLLSYFDHFLRVGVVETRLLLRLGPTDFSIMSWDWQMPQEDINRLREHVAMMVVKATIPDVDDTTEKFLKERSTIVYGRIYIPDAVQSFEYSLASFGATPPIGPLQIAMAVPEDGCAPMTADLTGKVVIIRRGTCTFLEKAQHALQAKASAVIAVNTVDGLESPSSGLGIDKTVTYDMVKPIDDKLSIVAVANTSWAKFQHTVENAKGSPVYLHIVPLRCGSTCAPVIAEEQGLQSEVSSGNMRLKTSQGEVRSFEFLTSTFGGRLPKQPFSVVVASVRNACSAMEPIQPTTSAIVAILVERGECHFDTKALNVQRAGGQLMIVVDPDDGPLQRLGGSFPESGYVGIPSVMTSMTAGAFMMSALALSAGAVDADTPRWVTGEMTFAKDNAGFEKWIEVADKEWAEDMDRHLMQIETLQQKFAQASSPEIVSWLQRKTDALRGVKHKSIATDEL